MREHARALAACPLAPWCLCLPGASCICRWREKMVCQYGSPLSRCELCWELRHRDVPCSQCTLSCQRLPLRKCVQPLRKHPRCKRMSTGEMTLSCVRTRALVPLVPVSLLLLPMPLCHPISPSAECFSAARQRACRLWALLCERRCCRY